MPVKFSRDVLKGTTKNTAGDFNQQSRFTVEIDGVTQGGIHKVDGLDHEHEMVAYQDADDHFQRIRPGRQKVGTLVLERDWSSSTEFYDWFKTVYEGNVHEGNIYEGNVHNGNIYEGDVYEMEDVNEMEAYDGDLHNDISRESKGLSKKLSDNINASMSAPISATGPVGNPKTSFPRRGLLQ